MKANNLSLRPNFKLGIPLKRELIRIFPVTSDCKTDPLLATYHANIVSLDSHQQQQQ